MVESESNHVPTDFEEFLRALADPAVRRRYQPQIARLIADLQQNAMSAPSPMSQEELDQLLTLYLEAERAGGDPALIYPEIEQLMERYPAFAAEYEMLRRALAVTDEPLADAQAAEPPLLPFLQVASPVGAPWHVHLRGRLAGAAPAIIIRLGNALTAALLAPPPAWAGATMRGADEPAHAQPDALRDAAGDVPPEPLLSQVVTLEGRALLAELLVRRRPATLHFTALLAGDEPLPVAAAARLRLGDTEYVALLDANGQADLGEHTRDDWARAAQFGPIELLFELPYPSAR